MTDWASVAEADEIQPGAVKVIELGGLRLAVCNVDGELFCIDDLCTHDGGPLDQGELLGGEIECPRHGARFDVRTGRALCLPAVKPVATHPVRIEAGKVQVRL